MGIYPAKVLERCRELRFAASCRDADASGRAANFDCGCVVSFSLKVDEDSGEIKAGYRSNGCGYMLASADILAETVGERQLSELHGLEKQELMAIINRELDGLPGSRENCALASIDALRAAFAELRAARIQEFRGERALVCSCFGVSEDTIEALIADSSIKTTDDIADACNAGSGCGSCRMLIQEMIDGRIHLK